MTWWNVLTLYHCKDIWWVWLYSQIKYFLHEILRWYWTCIHFNPSHSVIPRHIKVVTKHRFTTVLTANSKITVIRIKVYIGNFNISTRILIFMWELILIITLIINLSHLFLTIFCKSAKTKWQNHNLKY